MRDDLRGALIGALAAVGGTVLGVLATLHVADQQNQWAVEAEERATRAEVYASYQAAAWEYLSAQMELVRNRQNCLTEVTYEGSDEPICLVWNPDPLTDEHNAYVSARSNLAIYGTAAILAASDDLSAVVDPASPPFIPVSVPVYSYSNGLDPADDDLGAPSAVMVAYNDANEVFTSAMCAEVSTSPRACSERLQRPVPRPTAEKND